MECTIFRCFGIESIGFWVLLFGFVILAIVVVCCSICKDFKRIDEDAERKMNGLPPKKRRHYRGKLTILY